jgi:hypothetical protein
MTGQGIRLWLVELDRKMSVLFELMVLIHYMTYAYEIISWWNSSMKSYIDFGIHIHVYIELIHNVKLLV